MSHARTFRRGVGAVAAIGLAAATLTVLSAPSQAAPGDATITPSLSTNLNTVQVIQVSGNAGPLSARPDTTYPKLHVAMCRLPLTASSCDTDLTNLNGPVTGNPATDPHVVDVQPDANGNWGPIDFLVRKTIVNGDGRFQCGTGADQCVIGSANAPRPTDHAYDAIANLSFAPATLTPAPTAVTNGATVTVTGNNFPMQTVAVDDPTPKTQGIYLFQCALPISSSSCDSNNLFPATVDVYGKFTASMTVQQVVEGQNCGVVQCVVGSIKNPPGAPDAYSVYGPTTFAFPVPPHAEAVALNNRGTIYATGVQFGHATATRITKSISIQGAGYTPNTAFTSLELCDVDGLNCNASYLKGNTTLTNPVSLGSATATGTRQWQTYVDTTAPVGVHTVKIVQGAIVTVTPPFTILATPPTIAAPATVVAGQTITVTGSNWDPGNTVGEGGATADPTITVHIGSVSKTVLAGTDGSFSTTIQATDDTATAVTATSGGGGWLLNASSPIIFSPFAAQDDQNVELDVIGGDLTMSQAADLIVMSPITLNGTDQVSNGAVNKVTVTDARGSSAGWSLSARLTDLTTGGGTAPNSTIGASTFIWSPACQTTGGTAVVTPGTSTKLSNSDQTFCQVASGQGGGKFTADAGLSVPVPATQAAGLYTGILTLTLS